MTTELEDVQAKLKAEKKLHRSTNMFLRLEREASKKNSVRAKEAEDEAELLRRTLKTATDLLQKQHNLLTEIFEALDGTRGSFEYGEYKNGSKATIGGIYSFTSDWNDPAPEPSWRGEPWDTLTTEQKYLSSQFSAQHWLVKELADLKKKFDTLGDEK